MFEIGNKVKVLDTARSGAPIEMINGIYVIKRIIDSTGHYPYIELDNNIYVYFTEIIKHNPIKLKRKCVCS